MGVLDETDWHRFRNRIYNHLTQVKSFSASGVFHVASIFMFFTSSWIYTGFLY